MNDTIDISRQEGCFEFVRPEGFAGDVGKVGERSCEVLVACCCRWVDLNWGLGIGKEGGRGGGVREEGDEELGLGEG